MNSEHNYVTFGGLRAVIIGFDADGDVEFELLEVVGWAEVDQGAGRVWSEATPQGWRTIPRSRVDGTVAVETTTQALARVRGIALTLFRRRVPRISYMALTSQSSTHPRLRLSRGRRL